LWNRKTFRTSILVLLLITAFLPLLLNSMMPVKATGDNWLTGWLYRKSHVIVNASGSGAGYQVMVIVKNSSGSSSGNTVCEDGKAKADFSDLRFTGSDGNTLLYAWNESMFSQANITLWVKIAEDLSSSSVTIYLYYGKSDASAYWDGDATFVFFDDFSGSSVNRTKWENVYGSPVVSGGLLDITSIGNNEGLMSNWTTYGNFSYKAFRMRQSVVAWKTAIIGGFSSDLNGGVGSGVWWIGYSLNVSRVLSANTTSYSLTRVSDSVAGGWHNYDILWNSTRAEYYNDGNLTAFTYPSGYICNVAKPLMLYWYYSVAGGSFLTDWCFVRNYVGPEPSHNSWGAESSQLYYDLSKTGTNSTNSVSTWLFYSFWYSIANNLSGFIFSFNGSSSPVNDTWIPFPDVNNSWSNVTKSITIHVGNVISWLVYANSSTGIWTTLPMQNVTITANITFYVRGSGQIEANGTLLTNGTSIIYDQLTIGIQLSALPETGFSYLNFTCSYTSSTLNPFNFSVVNSTTIWCYLLTSDGVAPGGGGSLGWGAILVVLLIPILIVVLVFIGRKR